VTSPALSPAGWRKSTFSGADNCVEVGELEDGNVAIRDSKAPGGGSLVFPRTTFLTFIRAAKNGDFDDLC